MPRPTRNTHLAIIKRFPSAKEIANGAPCLLELSRCPGVRTRADARRAMNRTVAVYLLDPDAAWNGPGSCLDFMAVGPRGGLTWIKVRRLSVRHATRCGYGTSIVAVPA